MKQTIRLEDGTVIEINVTGQNIKKGKHAIVGTPNEAGSLTIHFSSVKEREIFAGLMNTTCVCDSVRSLIGGDSQDCFMRNIRHQMQSDLGCNCSWFDGKTTPSRITDLIASHTAIEK